MKDTDTKLQEFKSIETKIKNVQININENDKIHLINFDKINTELIVSRKEAETLKKDISDAIKDKLKNKKSDKDFEKIIDERVEQKVNEKMLKYIEEMNKHAKNVKSCEKCNLI